MIRNNGIFLLINHTVDGPNRCECEKWWGCRLGYSKHSSLKVHSGDSLTSKWLRSKRSTVFRRCNSDCRSDFIGWEKSEKDEIRVNGGIILHWMRQREMASQRQRDTTVIRVCLRVSVSACKCVCMCVYCKCKRVKRASRRCQQASEHIRNDAKSNVSCGWGWFMWVRKVLWKVCVGLKVDFRVGGDEMVYIQRRINSSLSLDARLCFLAKC